MLSSADFAHAFVDYPDVPVAHAPDGLLSGLSFAVKDIFDVAGYPTGCGNPVKRAESEPAKAHAPAVGVLLNAGARFTGKTHTPELASSLDGYDEHYGTPLNPAAPGRVPGGSSSGSAAAVAGCLVDFAIGSDTGGSVRSPASFCGLIGIRPTHGRIDTGGSMPLAPTFDTVGWFAREVSLFQKIGAVLLGEDIEGPALRRMVVAQDLFEQVGDAERLALRPALALLNEHFQPSGATRLAGDNLSVSLATYRTIQGFEAWQAHGSWIESHKQHMTRAIRERFELASSITVDQYRRAHEVRNYIRDRILSIASDDCVIALPTTPTIAPLTNSTDVEREAFRLQALSMLCLAALAGLPQISLPLAEVEGCPFGLSLMGPPNRDKALIVMARTVLVNRSPQ